VAIPFDLNGADHSLGTAQEVAVDSTGDVLVAYYDNSTGGVGEPPRAAEASELKSHSRTAALALSHRG
jgi:hypothetical protein